MNKKILAALILGSCFTGLAQAATVTLTASGASQSITDANCGAGGTNVLKESFIVSLSNNVSGAYNCDTNIVGIATSNRNGRGAIYRGNTAGGRVTEYCKDGTTSPCAALGTNAAKWGATDQAGVTTAVGTAAGAEATAARSQTGTGT